MKQIINLLGSMKTMAVLMSFFAFAVGYATFIENDYGTITAKADIYNARWFEILLFLLTINLIQNIFKYKMFTLKKAPIFIFHVAFLIIIFGAAVTRYIGYEGTMHIREGASASTMVSTNTYFTVDATSNDKKAMSEEIVYLSKRTKNSLESSLVVDGKNVDVELIKYIPDAIEIITEDKEHGKPMAQMMVTGNGKGEPIILSYGEFYISDKFILDFNSKQDFSENQKTVISLFIKDSQLFMSHDVELDYLYMDDSTSGKLARNENESFTTRTLFSYKGGGFVLRKFDEFASKKIITNPNASPQRPMQDAFEFKISVDDVSSEVVIFGEVGRVAKEYHNIVNGVDIHISFGSKILQLPFSIFLKDFQLDRYPGSMSPASYASEVVLVDKEQEVEMPYRIFMNNILEHRGYRFFQASYDRDEKGTVLSVNNDPGTLPSYIGYFLLTIGMFWSLFSKENRFAKLAARAKKASSALLIGLVIIISQAPSYASDINPAFKTIVDFDKEHSAKFAKLIIQDSAGRMKPVNTLASEILAKVHKGSSIIVNGKKLDVNQVILGMMMRPDIYRGVDMIRTKNKDVNKLIGANENAKHVSFAQFFVDAQKMRGYKLAQSVEKATMKEPKYRDMFDKAILKIDERVNIVYMVYTGSVIKLWPKPNEINNKWFPTLEALQTFNTQDAEKLRDVAVNYFAAIDESLKTGNWNKADEAVAKIAEYQKFYGASVYPSDNRISAEVLYNEAKIFETLYPLYLLVGFILLIFSFTKVLKPKLEIKMISKISLGLLIVFFLAHTFGLALRWYISGHAPWSNGYESMIYIGWATVLAGFIFSKRSPLTLSSTAILTGLILFVAHLNWMDPQVTNLVPVLNSYWLSIHVATITASYGFLGLGALLGFITMLLFIFKNNNNNKRISNSIIELNAINEMSLMAGLVLLTVGNFLGGVWANESWGRYWGWDPKETWALVTILIYAVVVHLRFIKSIYSEFNFAVISLLSFTSVLMTYFGVNYYLAGLHSYAKGDPVPVPDFVPITYAIIFIIIIFAFRNRMIASK
ncbi:MAG: cytochrome c biogenesis protein CcsA [Campylobacterota bacterium]|nr:cytochrome c biogenesis protein CcsA [Campylobacterota bacterium]